MLCALKKSMNSITLVWKSLECDEVSDKLEDKYSYIVQKHCRLNGWENVYRGYKNQCEVRNLMTTTCYQFRLALHPPLDPTSETDVNDADLAWSEVFRVATLDPPPYVDHLTRAIEKSKMPTIRKILQANPILIETSNAKMNTPLTTAVKIGDGKVVSLLLTAGADVNGRCSTTKRTALMIAMFNGELSIAALLLERNGRWDPTDCNGLTAMHYAVDSNVLNNVLFAIKNGADPRCKDNKKWSPLFRAVILECDLKIIRILVRYGQPEEKDKCGLNCMDHARLSNRDDIERVLRKGWNLKPPSTQ